MKRYSIRADSGASATGANIFESGTGYWVSYSDHEAALKAAVAAEREKSAEMLTQFAAAIRHQCRGRIGDLVANMALAHAAAIRGSA